MDFTLSELQSIMTVYNAAGYLYIEKDIRDVVAKKLEAAIEEMKDKPVFKEVPEDLKKMGVLSIEVVRGDKSY